MPEDQFRDCRGTSYRLNKLERSREEMLGRLNRQRPDWAYYRDPTARLEHDMEWREKMSRDTFKQQKRYLGGPASGTHGLRPRSGPRLPPPQSNGLIRCGLASSATAPLLLQEVVLPLSIQGLAVAHLIV